MKFSNLFLALVLAVFSSITLIGQSNSNHVVTINNDDESMHIEYEDGIATMLIINGDTILKKDYPTYQNIIDEHKSRTRTNQTATQEAKHSPDMKTTLLENLKAYLVENEGMSPTKFEFKLTSQYIKLNGKKLNKDRLKDCLEIFDNAAGYSLNDGSYFEVDISPKSRSVSLSIQD